VDGKTEVAGGADIPYARTASPMDELWSSLHADWITAPPSGGRRATASKDRTVKVLDAATGKLFTTYTATAGSTASTPAVPGVRLLRPGIAYQRRRSGGARVEPSSPGRTQRHRHGSPLRQGRAHAYLEFTAVRPVFALTLSGGQIFTAAAMASAATRPKGGPLVREYSGPDLYASRKMPPTSACGRGFDGESGSGHGDGKTQRLTFVRLPALGRDRIVVRLHCEAIRRSLRAFGIGPDRR